MLHSGVNECMSKVIIMNSGVFQGRLLWPILFWTHRDHMRMPADVTSLFKIAGDMARVRLLHLGGTLFTLRNC